MWSQEQDTKEHDKVVNTERVKSNRRKEERSRAQSKGAEPAQSEREKSERDRLERDRQIDNTYTPRDEGDHRETHTPTQRQTRTYIHPRDKNGDRRME